MLSCGTRLACRHFGGLSCGTGSLARLCNLVGKCSDLGNDGDVDVGMIDALIHGVEIVDNLLTGITQVANLGVLLLANFKFPAARPAGSGDNEAVHCCLLLSIASRASLTTFGEHSVVWVMMVHVVPLRHFSWSPLP